MLDFARARRNMVDNQLRTFDVTDRAVLAAMAAVPRERFMPEAQAPFAYLDRHVNVAAEGGEPRWMIEPMVLARLLQELEIEPGTKALDVASGHGYSAAVLSEIGADVLALESDEGLAASARGALAGAGLPVDVAVGPLADGHPARAPYDVILVNGAVEERPERLLAQLADGGRLACLMREGAAGHALLYVRAGDAFGIRRLFDAAAPVLPAFRVEPSFQF